MPPVDRSGHPLCILTVHAHPDDEASKGAGTIAKYSQQGIRTVLVCCTGGEEGDVLNPAADTPEIRERLDSVRAEELAASAAAIGYASVHLLGYRDSGMADTEANARPDNFANAPLDEATERLVRIIRAERPHVVVTYPDEHGFYPHPDHVRTHEVGVAAFEAAGDGSRFAGSGPPWSPSKLYYTGFTLERVEALHGAYEREGIESPYGRWFERGFSDHAMTADAWIDVADFLHHRRAALLAHRTQIDPEGFWMRLSDETLREVFPWEEYVLARSTVDNGVADGEREDDLFAGIRGPDAASGRAAGEPQDREGTWRAS